MRRIATLIAAVAVLSGCGPQYLYPVGSRSMLPVATSYIKDEPGLFGSLSVGGFGAAMKEGTRPLGVKIDGSMGIAKKHIVVEGYGSGSLGRVDVVHYNSTTMQDDSLDFNYHSIMAGLRGMATFPLGKKFALGVGPDIFYYSENGDYETFRRVNHDTSYSGEFRRIGNNEGFGMGLHIDEKFRMNEKVAIGMQQAIVMTNLSEEDSSGMIAFQVADNIYVDLFDQNRFYVQIGLGKGLFAGIGYRFLMYGKSSKREAVSE